MTLLEASVTILSGILALLGGGAAVRWIDARRSITERALDMAGHGREDTQRHVTELVSCERRCAALEHDMRALTAERDALAHRVAALEREVALMRRAIDALLAGERPTHITSITPIGGRRQA